MRKVIVNNIVSLDGYYADADADPLILNMDEAFDQANLEDIEAADIVLLGRDSFEGFSAYWPFIADAPAVADPDSPEGRQYDEANRAISRRWNVVPKVVVSDRGPVPSSNAWAGSTTQVSRADVAEWLASGEGVVVVFGSRVLWNDLLRQGLVDELHLMISPDAVVTGVRLFETPANLELQEARRFDGSSNVQLRYAVTASE
jgi:dihydrofolate reductase